ncbi:MAG: GHMP kinase, partial [Actinobacteria bacterium]|nr:GHMP kinase [Actinomycetota bacterium]
SRTPFRISFVGGGSDLPAFYNRSKGAVLSITINKYMYISVHPYFNRKQFQVKYSKTELCNSVEEIQHPIIRETLKFLKIGGGLEIISMADVPAGTGLGSSSSFTVGLLHTLYSFLGKFVSKDRLASEASFIEIEKVEEPIGKQDQYAAAYGGLNIISFNVDGSVDVEPINIKMETFEKLNNNLILFYTKMDRRADSVLRHQSEEIMHEEKFEAQQKMVNLVYKAVDALYRDDLDEFGKILHENWILKKSLSDKISNSQINRYYERALEYGALGGKLLGAGGGGFLLFYCPEKNQDRLKKALFDLYELKFSFDQQGSKIIYVGDKDWDEYGFFE